MTIKYFLAILSSPSLEGSSNLSKNFVETKSIVFFKILDGYLFYLRAIIGNSSKASLMTKNINLTKLSLLGFNSDSGRT